MNMVPVPKLSTIHQEVLWFLHFSSKGLLFVSGGIWWHSYNRSGCCSGLISLFDFLKVSWAGLIQFTSLYQSPVFEWFLARCGSKNEQQKDICFEEIGLKID